MLEAILQCPVTGAELVFADEARLGELNRRIGRGEAGEYSRIHGRQPIERALTTTDGRYAYPLVDGIFLLLPSLAIGREETSPALAAETQGVMSFYDDFGWQVGEEEFLDAEVNEDLRPVSRDYSRRCHLRVNKYIQRPGRYLLDVASGPLQYPEYLTYSEGYERHLCADVSLVALRAARERLGDKGIYLQCDITSLPFRDGTMDGFVSLHTVNHVPAGKQEQAFRELERVLAPGRTGVVVYTWDIHCLAMRLLAEKLRPVRAGKRLLRRLVPDALVARWKGAPAAPVAPDSRESAEGPPLYFHAHDPTWFKAHILAGGRWQLRVWRSVCVLFLRRYIHPRLGGRFLLAALYSLENAFPYLCGRFGQHPLLVFPKPDSV